MVHKKTWKIVDIINTTTRYFTEKKIENPRLNAEMLLGKVLNMSRVDLYVAFDRPLSEQEIARYRELVRLRANRQPLQYLLGETEFMGLPFDVTPAVLIPRPETEILVQAVLDLKAEIKSEQPVLVDVGTGSGCVAVSVAKLWPQARIYATDISREALAVAEKNAERNQVAQRIAFCTHDIFRPWPQELPDKVDVLISNPPYIGKEELSALEPEVAQFEPRIALTDEQDGLRFYRRFFQLAFESGAPECGYLALEMSGAQPQKIVALAKERHTGDIRVINDLNQIPRVLIIKVNHE